MMVSFQEPNGALEHLGKALGEIRSAKGLQAMWYHLGLAFRDAGLWEEAVSAFEKSIQQSPETPWALKSALFLARVFVLQGNLERARELLKWAENRVTTDRDRLRVATVWAGLYFAQEAYEEAWNTVSRLLERAKQLKEKYPEDLAYVLVSAGGLASVQGKLSDAEQHLAHAKQIFSQLARGRKHDRGLLVTNVNLGEVYRLKGDYRASREMLEQALALAEKHGMEDFMADARMNLAHTLVDAGEDLERASRLLDQAEAFYRARTSLKDLVEIRWIRAKLLWNQGDREKALALAREAMEQATQYALTAKQAAIAETLYRWTGERRYQQQALKAYERVGNHIRVQELQREKPPEAT